MSLSALRTDARLARTLMRGSDRREWRRAALTAFGALLATGFALAAVTVGAITGQVHIPFGANLLGQPGQRAGVVVALLLLLIPVLALLGQCARIGAVHRDRRLAALRLAGATPLQVRRIAALEAGLASLAGSVAGALLFAVLLVAASHRPWPLAWPGYVLVVLGVPVLTGLVSALALRRVVTSPLGHFRRTRPERGEGRPLALLVPALLVLSGVAVWTVVGLTGPGSAGDRAARAALPLGLLAFVVLAGAGAVALAGSTSRLLGRRLGARTGSPAVLLAASRLREDPWATARTHAAVLLVTVVATGFTGVRSTLLHGLAAGDHPMDLTFYTTGIDLTGAVIAVGLAISLTALAVGTAETLATRHRALSAQTAAGVPRRVLARALLLETALPLAPAVVVAALAGLVIHLWYAGLGEGPAAPFPLGALLLPPVLAYALSLLAAALSLPALRRAADPSGLRYA